MIQPTNDANPLPAGGFFEIYVSTPIEIPLTPPFAKGESALRARGDLVPILTLIGALEEALNNFHFVISGKAGIQRNQHASHSSSHW